MPVGAQRHDLVVEIHANTRNPAEAKPSVCKPEPPEFLSALAKAEWSFVVEELIALGIMTRIDRAALAAYCQAFGRWQQAEQALAAMAEKSPATSALVIKTVSGNVIQNPLVGVANKAMGDMVRCAAEFGMTPSARSRVTVDPHAGTARNPSRFFD